MIKDKTGLKIFCELTPGYRVLLSEMAVARETDVKCRLTWRSAVGEERNQQWNIVNVVNVMTHVFDSLWQSRLEIIRNSNNKKPTNWRELAKRYAAQTVSHCPHLMRSKRNSTTVTIGHASVKAVIPSLYTSVLPQSGW